MDAPDTGPTTSDLIRMTRETSAGIGNQTVNDPVPVNVRYVGYGGPRTNRLSARGVSRTREHMLMTGGGDEK